LNFDTGDIKLYDINGKLKTVHKKLIEENEEEEEDEDDGYNNKFSSKLYFIKIFI